MLHTLMYSSLFYSILLSLNCEDFCKDISFPLFLRRSIPQLEYFKYQGIGISSLNSEFESLSAQQTKVTLADQWGRRVIISEKY